MDPVLNSAVDPVRVIFHLNAFKSFLHFNLAASAARLTIINFFLLMANAFIIVNLKIWQLAEFTINPSYHAYVSLLHFSSVLNSC